MEMNFLFSVFSEGFSLLIFDQLLCFSPFMCRWCQLQTSLDFFRAHPCQVCTGSSLLGLNRILMDFISLSFTRKSNNQQQNVYFLTQPRVAFKLEELQHQCPPLVYFHFSILVSERWVKRGKGIFKKNKDVWIPGEMQYLNVRVKHWCGLFVLEGCRVHWIVVSP